MYLYIWPYFFHLHWIIRNIWNNKTSITKANLQDLPLLFDKLISKQGSAKKTQNMSHGFYFYSYIWPIVLVDVHSVITLMWMNLNPSLRCSIDVNALFMTIQVSCNRPPSDPRQSTEEMISTLITALLLRKKDTCLTHSRVPSYGTDTLLGLSTSMLLVTGECS